MPDPPAVTARRAALHAQQLVAYWIVVSLQDGLALLDGRVSAAVRRQALVVKRGRAESADAYAARLAELGT